MRKLFEYMLVLYSLTGTISITVSQAVMSLGALVGVLDRGRTIAWRRTGLEWPVLGWLAATLLATAFAAEPDESLTKIKKVLLFGMVWWAPAVIRGGWRLGRLYMGLLFSAGTTSLYGVLVFFMQGGPELAVRINGFHGFYLTHSAMLLLCTFPAVLFTLCRTIPASHRWGAGIAATSILAAAFFGRLPSVWLGMAAGFLLLAYRRRSLRLAAAVPAVVLALVVIPGVFQETTRAMLDPGSAQNTERLAVWRNGLRLFAQDPVTGWGLQDLGTAYADVKEPEDPHQGQVESVPIQILASMGVPGLAAFAWLMFAMFRRLGHARRSVGDDPFLRDVVDGSEAGLVAFLAQGIVEWNFGDSEVIALLFFLVGAALASVPRPEAASAERS
ncbi:MAG: hypothetical protein HKN12_03885 [Gemmatimonadetes bacterium]|nr:hypothetical protein [Gemmatimonadota bacterium]